MSHSHTSLTSTQQRFLSAADIADQLRDVGGRQFLQVVRAQQPGPRGLLAILGGQVTQVAHVDRTLKLNPWHDNTFADPLAT